MNYARTCHVFFFFLCYINLFFCITLPYCLFAIVCSMLWPNNGVPQKSKYDNDFHNRLHRHLTGCLFSALQKLQFLVFSNFWIHEENKLRYNASKDAQLRSRITLLYWLVALTWERRWRVSAGMPASWPCFAFFLPMYCFNWKSCSNASSDVFCSVQQRRSFINSIKNCFWLTRIFWVCLSPAV